MPVEVSWLVENRVVYTRSFGVLSISQVHEAAAQSTGMMNTGIKPVHLITNATDIERFTFNLPDIAKSFRGFPASPNMGWTLTVSPHAMHRFFASIVVQMGSSRQRVFNTLEEAMAFLQSIDETLPPIPFPTKEGEK